MDEVKLLPGEEGKIRAIFFFIGLLLSLPSHVIVNVSFLINHLYNEEIFVIVMGIVSGCMIVSSLFQLTFESTSFKAIIIFNSLNTLNLLVLLVLICICKASKYYIYFICGIIGLFIGYLYSACTKYSLLMPIKVNGYMISGISFSALFFFVINLIMSYFTIEDGNAKSYYNAISMSIGTIVLIEFCIIVYIIFVQFSSPYFMNQRQIIEASMCKGGNKDCSSTNNNNTTQLSEVEKGNKKKKSSNIINSTSEKVDESVSIITILKNKFVNLKNMFNCTNIFHGAQLIRYYYTCIIPISFSIFISSTIYPHMIPNKLNKGVYLKYLFMFLYQSSDLIFSLLVTVYLTAFNFFKQKYVVILCLIRVVLLGLALKIKNLEEDAFMYSNSFVSLVIFILGATNGSLINISYARIHECFEESDKKEKNIAVSSSFCALSLLMSFALAPWFCRAIINL
ncbi:nucleoside transporter 4, putative [Plasmodium malariae]|uniref:Nucleoside transporter 4, putative n=1 Tax=Plasmodium malariae TaxID=5858 RepID=A0A1C3K9Y2_PLAMA|nr:nucleoside transporter 4, putative [Plasmodium malariae]